MYIDIYLKSILQYLIAKCIEYLTKCLKDENENAQLNEVDISICDKKAI